MDKDFLTVKEVAQKLNVSEFTIKRRIKEKRLRAYKFGGEYRISESDLQEFIKSSMVK
ncbi:helix-turn-helix domain-containing protein [Atribacter laminatus]|uniref:Helix-turn-helix domain-containing protein n=1 Tax=Atribacter laminatus TaxID=2847778 RepID=A0A7T1ALM6_ATRLM|nr:helix-turn-helix domain-containing protein [Atribacter laminatus]QPM68202.1 hypothetical protein RT761_01417 [Atribacter laminatus]